MREPRRGGDGGAAVEVAAHGRSAGRARSPSPRRRRCTAARSRRARGRRPGPRRSTPIVAGTTPAVAHEPPRTRGRPRGCAATAARGSGSSDSRASTGAPASSARRTSSRDADDRWCLHPAIVGAAGDGCRGACVARGRTSALARARARMSDPGTIVVTCVATSHRRPGPREALRRVRRRRRHLLRGRAGRVVRPARSERRRQVDHDAHGRRGLDAHRRRPRDPRARPRRARPRDPVAARRRAAVRQPRHRAARAREPARLRPLLRAPAPGRRRAGRRAARVRAARRQGQGEGRRPSRAA